MVFDSDKKTVLTHACKIAIFIVGLTLGLCILAYIITIPILGRRNQNSTESLVDLDNIDNLTTVLTEPTHLELNTTTSITGTTPVASVCSDSEFACTDGNCIRATFECDGFIGNIFVIKLMFFSEHSMTICCLRKQ